MRCSTVPLVSNPSYTLLHEILIKPWSLLGPNDTPGQIHLSASKLYYAKGLKKGRRYQRPTWSVTVAQSLFSTVLGAAAAIVSRQAVSGHYYFFDDDHDAYIAWWTLWASILTLVLPVLTTTLDGVSHELHPKYYRLDEHLGTRLVLPEMQKATRTTVWALVLATLLTWATTPAASKATSWWSSIHHTRQTAPWFVAFLLMSLFVHLLDLVMRTSLFTPPFNVRSLVTELEYDGTSTPYLTVLVNGLLRNSVVAKQVLAPTAVVRTGSVDHDELERCQQMGRQLELLSPVHWPEAELEEDILQLTILASLAAPSRRAVRELVNTTTTTRRQDPPILALVRALCVYSWGLTEALHACHRRLPLASKEAANSTTYILPPGLQCAAEWAVQGLGNCLVQNDLGRDWKASPVSVTLPTGLETIFGLRQAVVEFGRLEKTAWHDEGLLVRACDIAAAQVLHVLKTPVPLQPPTLDWARELQAQPTTR